MLGIMLNEVFYSLNQADKKYKVNNVSLGFNYWYWKLFNFIQRMFIYENLPDTLPAREIELNLLLTGHCVVFWDNNVPGDGIAEGALITANTNIWGYDLYYRPTNATFANPIINSRNLEIGKDCEIIYNNSLMDNISYIPTDGSLNTFISRYARQLADIESTINIYAVNSRIVSFPVASNDNVMQSLKSFFKKWRNGESSIITDDTIINEFRNVDITNRNIKDGINDWLIARDKILEQFYREIGVKMYNPKKAQVNNEEVEANDQLLLISHDDMLEQRKEGIERINQHYGTNINVYINPKFDTYNDGVNDGKEVNYNGKETV